jgi:hypothetical protein
MSTPFANVHYVVKIQGTQTIVGDDETLSDGKRVFNLPPGEYTVEITVPEGYEVENSALTEPGQAVLNSSNPVIQNVTITEGGITVIVTNFLTA